MDIFSLASNLQQIAIGGVNFVNNKLRKKNSPTRYNYITYIVIGENEKYSQEVNMFFLPLKYSNKIKFKEFKEYFPFKDNIIFRFKLLLTDLIDVINDRLRSNIPLLKQKENKENLSDNIISDETEIKNILKKDTFNYIWIDINNDEAYIPLYYGKIVVKVLFINNENYRSYDEIYFNNYKFDNSPIYTMNEKHLCSYKFIKEENQNRKSSLYSNDIMESENFDDSDQIIISKNNLMSFHFFDDSKEFDNEIANNDELKSKNENKNFVIKNSRSNILNETCEKTNKKEMIGSENEIFFQNEDNDKIFGKKRNNSDVLNLSHEINRINNMEKNENENIKNEKNSNKLIQKGINENISEKSNYASSKTLSSAFNSNLNYDYSLNHCHIKKNSKDPKAKVCNRLQELKESRYHEKATFKEKMLISEDIKKEIFKWYKNSNHTYKDIKVMLSTLNDVLWKNAEWKTVSMSDLISNPKIVKKTYKKAILLCHPDKHRDKPLEQMLRAEMIFQALNNAYKEKKHI